MNTSDIIAIILSALSFLLAALSLVFIWLTLRQNNKMLYANSRPYIAVYFAYEENNCEMFICVKNHGHSSAIIRTLKLIPDLEIMQLSIGESLLGTMLAPNQQIHFGIPQKNELMQKGPYQYKINISYEDVNKPGKIIEENYCVDLNYMLQVVHTEHNRSNLDKAENAICNMEKDLKAIVLNNL